jgi:surface polysaccharide O-acyltransferase-like enzyme
VDLIRTLAIVLVILLHAAIEPTQIVYQMSPDGVSLWWTVNIYDSLARPCVPLFVMLAGALLLQPSKATEALNVFFKKRMRRIALPFLFWGITYFAWRFFVNQEAFSLNSVITGVLTGPYIHFWFLYMLVGLYLITPILRIVVAHAECKTIKYFFLVWFLGTSIIPLITLTGTYRLNNSVFIVTGWIGYFLLGGYIQKIRLRPLILYMALLLGITWTIIGTYIVTGTMGEHQSQFFYDSFSVNVIVLSVALFLLLGKVSPSRLKSRFPKGTGLLSLISQNTLPIYLLHLIILETFQKGYLGFKISLSTLNPALEIPLITAATLFTCLGLVYALKKIPYVGKIIG